MRRLCLLRWSGLWGCALLLGCASSPSVKGGESGGEIGQLERRIATAKGKLSGGDSSSGGMSSAAQAPAASPSTRPESVGGRCDQVCLAAEEICTCYRRICSLADDLKDARSNESCRRASTDCEEASRQCARCR